MMELSHAERLAVELMLAYMEPRPVVRAACVCQIEAVSGLTPHQFDAANCTAWAAAQFWLQTNPELGRQLLAAKLTELTAVA